MDQSAPERRDEKAVSEEAKKKAAEEIAEKTDQAMKLIRECEEIAKKHNLSFSFQVAYGMGGTFNAGADWDSSGCEWENSGCTNYEPEWSASSHEC